MLDTDQVQVAARAIAEATLGRDPGQLVRLASRSHHVFAGAAVVVKVIDADDHARLDREVALAAALPSGLSAPVLSSGAFATGAGEVRYACVARLPGSSPGMGLAGVDRESARHWAKQAVRQLQRLHDWAPASVAATILREPLDHGGFVGRARLLDAIDRVRDVDDEQIVPRPVLDGLAAIAEGAPEHAGASVAVHADCHWGNWLVHEQRVTALLDFEWARFGEAVDDWVFLSRFSGPHRHAVLEVVADETGTSLESLRAACEVREAAYLTSDLSLALQARSARARVAAEELVGDLRELAVSRSWWPPGGD